MKDHTKKNYITVWWSANEMHEVELADFSNEFIVGFKNIILIF